MTVTNEELKRLLDILPFGVQTTLEKNPEINQIIEIVLDLGRPAEARFSGKIFIIPGEVVTQEDIDHVVNQVGIFTSDNRAGIERTLHRISCIRNRTGKIIGLTCRVGRSILGTIDVIRDVIEAGKNVLFMGPPGIGKTTKLREAARVLSVDFGRRVIVVDTSNEIAGDGDIPHHAIGTARRMQVPSPEMQHKVMIEAVENHMPEVVIVDEIGTEAEALACRTIAERGVQLIATAHGNTLENILSNPTLSDLVGGIQSVILGDDEAKRRHTQKAILERKAPPTFDIAIEIAERDKFAIYSDVAKAIDMLLRNRSPQPEIRLRGAGGKVEVLQKPLQVMPEPVPEELEKAKIEKSEGPSRIYPFGINQQLLDRAINSMKIPARVAPSLDEADMILTIKSKTRPGTKIMVSAESHNLPVHAIRKNVSSQIIKFLKFYFRSEVREEKDAAALREVETAIEQVMDTKKAVDLNPQNAYLRRIQHQKADEAGLRSESMGEEPRRRVRIYP